jgi:hypothetical protein
MYCVKPQQANNLHRLLILADRFRPTNADICELVFLFPTKTDFCRPFAVKSVKMEACIDTSMILDTIEVSSDEVFRRVRVRKLMARRDAITAPARPFRCALAMAMIDVNRSNRFIYKSPYKTVCEYHHQHSGQKLRKQCTKWKGVSCLGSKTRWLKPTITV